MIIKLEEVMHDFDFPFSFEDVSKEIVVSEKGRVTTLILELKNGRQFLAELHQSSFGLYLVTVFLSELGIWQLLHKN
jgi:hypothetical protein